jgi:hypothetical protein
MSRSVLPVCAKNLRLRASGKVSGALPEECLRALASYLYQGMADYDPITYRLIPIKMPMPVPQMIQWPPRKNVA